MRSSCFLVLALLFCRDLASGYSHIDGDDSNFESKEKQQAPSASGDKNEKKVDNSDKKANSTTNTITRLMEILTDVGVQFDPKTITPDEVTQLVKEHKVISRHAKLKRKSTKSRGSDGKEEDITSAKNNKRNWQIKVNPKRAHKPIDDKKKRVKKRLLKTGRVDYSYIKDPVKRDLLERISKKGIVPNAKEMSIEQLERMDQTLYSSPDGEL